MSLIITFVLNYRQRAELSRRQKEAGLPIRNLVGEVSTRWGSKYTMVQRIYENKQALQSLLMNGNISASWLLRIWNVYCFTFLYINHYLILWFDWCIVDRKFAKICPSWDSICLMEMFVLTMGPFSTLTDILSTEKTVSISNLYPLMQHIKKTCESDLALKMPDASEEIIELSRLILRDVWTYIKTR